MKGGWPVFPLLLLLLRALPAAPAAPKRAPRLAPGLLPRPAPSPGRFVDVAADTWTEAAKHLFPSGTSVQTYWVKGSSLPHSERERAAADVLRAVAEAVADTNRLFVPSLLWTVEDGRLPPQSVAFSDAHRDDRLGHNVVVVAAYVEDDDSGGVHSISELLKTGLWNAKSRYTLVLDTHALPEDRRCSLAVARTVARSLWVAKSALVAVLLAPCPWRLVLYAPLVEDPDKRTVFVDPTNVSAMAEVVNAEFHNFHGQKWGISIYPNYPTLAEVPDAKGKIKHVGVDGWVMRAAAHYFNFTAEITYPEDQDSHGYSSDGVTGTGTLGAVMSGRAWISFNGRFVKDYNTREVDFTFPYVFDELCVMVPPSERIPNYITLFRVFTLGVWGLLLVTYASTVATVYGLDWAHGPRRRRRPDVSDAFFAVYSLMLGGTVNQPHARAREVSTLLLLAMGLLFSVTFMGAFQGLLFKRLTSPQYYPEIDTLNELADSGILITTRSQSLADTFAFPSMRRLHENFRLVARNWTSKKPFSFLIRRNGAYLRLENKPLHLVAECPRKYMLAYIVHRNFPYAHEMGLFLQRCMDAGLMAKWIRDTYDSVPEPRGDDDLVLSLFEVEAAFFVLAIGIVASTIVFAAELLRLWLRPRPRPHPPPRRRTRPPGPPPRPRPGPPPPYDGQPRRGPRRGLAEEFHPQVLLAARQQFRLRFGTIK